MRPLLILIFTFTMYRGAFAHAVEQYVKEKGGITIFAFISLGSVEERKLQDAFLDRLVQKLKRRDKSVSIYLFVDQFKLFRYRRNESFASIAYDALKAPDPEFVQDYFYYRMGPLYRPFIHSSSIKYQIDLAEPLDLGSTYSDSKAPFGLKVIYEYGIADSTTIWDRIYTLVQYAVDQIDEIKREQKRITLLYPVSLGESDTVYHKTEVSFLTIDTSKLNHIPLSSLGFDPSKLRDNKIGRNFILIGSVVLFFLLLFWYLKKRPQLTRGLASWRLYE